MENELATGHSLDDGTIVWTRARRLVPAPDAPPHRVESPLPTLAVATLRLVARRHGMLVRTVGTVPSRDRHLAISELTGRGSCRLPVALEESPRRVGDVSPQLVERQ
jgi:hypothetical protein